MQLSVAQTSFVGVKLGQNLEAIQDGVGAIVLIL